MGGDSNVIWIYKGSRKVVFDIKVEVPKGIVFAVYYKEKISKEVVTKIINDKEKKARENIPSKVTHSVSSEGHNIDGKMKFEVRIEKSVKDNLNLTGRNKCETNANEDEKI